MRSGMCSSSTASTTTPRAFAASISRIRAARLRILAMQLRGYAALTVQTAYQAKMLKAAADLELEAARLCHSFTLVPPQARRTG